jgi:8-hydroxy-5-deazaflavin:NADPH oxidoreductase
MKIAIIGTGQVGQTLGNRFALAGHQVMFGSRLKDAPEVIEAIARIRHGVEIGQVDEAIEESEIVFLATPYESAKQVIKSKAISNKIVVDVSNPLNESFSALTVGHSTSGAETLQQLAPSAKVVKAFNTTGVENMANPQYSQAKLFMPVASNDLLAKTTVMQLAQDIGFDAIDAGDLTAARLLEPMGMLWISLAYRQGMGRGFGFALHRREEVK